MRTKTYTTESECKQALFEALQSGAIIVKCEIVADGFAVTTTSAADEREAMQVAETIRAQLGGNRFAAMTGAKDFIGGANYLTFRLPSRFARDGINCVRVRLNGADLYDVDFLKIWGTRLKVVSQVQNVYADQLRDVFTAQTGLDTSM